MGPVGSSCIQAPGTTLPCGSCRTRPGGSTASGLHLGPERKRTSRGEGRASFKRSGDDFQVRSSPAPMTLIPNAPQMIAV